MSSKNGPQSEPPTELVEVEGKVGFTINLGNYESLRIDIGERRVVNAGISTDQAHAELRLSLEKQIEILLKESQKIKDKDND